MKFDHHTMILLVRPPDAPVLDDEEADRLQDAHLAHQAKLRDQGYILAAGPVVNPADVRLRGIVVFATDAETALRLYSDNPSVKAGRLAMQVMSWMVPAGNVQFAKVSGPRSMAEAEEG